MTLVKLFARVLFKVNQNNQIYLATEIGSIKPVLKIPIENFRNASGMSLSPAQAVKMSRDILKVKQILLDWEFFRPLAKKHKFDQGRNERWAARCRYAEAGIDDVFGESEPRHPLQTELNITPYDFQSQMFARTHRKGRIILMAQVGSGKTIVSTQELIATWEEVGEALNCIIFCPNHIKTQWRKELEKISNVFHILEPPYQSFTGEITTNPNVINVAVVSKNLRREREWAWDYSKANVVVTNHEKILTSDLRFMLGKTWDLVVFDEAKPISNPNSQINRKFRKIKCRRLILMTATPIENSLLDLHTLASFVDPAVFSKSRKCFKQNYLDIGENGEYNVVKMCMLPDFNRRASRVLCSARPEIVESQKPEIEIIDLFVELSERERLVYKLIEEQLGFDQVLMNAEFDANASSVKRLGVDDDNVKLLRCDQFCCHPWLLLTEENIEQSTKSEITNLAQDSTYISSTMERIINFCDEIVNGVQVTDSCDGLISKKPRQLLAFSRFAQMVKLTHRSLSDRGFNVGMVYGQMEAEGLPNFEQVVEQFKRGEIDILLTTDKLKRGLNAQFCHNLLNIDGLWNPASLIQRAGRIWRIGSQHKKTIWNIIVEDTISAKKYEIARFKWHIAQKALKYSKKSSRVRV